MQKLKQLNVLFVEDDELVRDAFILLVENLFKNLYVTKNAYETCD
jgi:vacuolar-type H+-ATPase catalytic subunit A/Vma1